MELWLKVTESVTPLHKRARSSTSISTSDPAQEPPKHSEPRRRARDTAAATRKASVARVPATQAPKLPPLTGIDRRTSQRLLRGQIAIEARIDLHGESAETARVRLFAYLSQAYERGNRFVIVITGKGSAPLARHMLHGLDPYDTPERAGRLRRAVPEWLNEPQFRRIVSGFQPAHPKHGGGGALYVRLRKNPDRRP
ncbi:Smr/MutS family protein [Rhodoligotrophos defluvii]|uniref:Smr/MutS family protein n=1 Tax=Rhodoligotrophos defluvii TaxID=2561934 RepID=UPI001EEF982D|nr:Smr/MutS family protein [Rhodoligotrophos defluvii]